MFCLVSHKHPIEQNYIDCCKLPMQYRKAMDSDASQKNNSAIRIKLIFNNNNNKQKKHYEFHIHVCLQKACWFLLQCESLRFRLIMKIQVVFFFCCPGTRCDVYKCDIVACWFWIKINCEEVRENCLCMRAHAWNWHLYFMLQLWVGQDNLTFVVSHQFGALANRDSQWHICAYTQHQCQ